MNEIHSWLWREWVSWKPWDDHLGPGFFRFGGEYLMGLLDPIPKGWWIGCSTGKLNGTKKKAPKLEGLQVYMYIYIYFFYKLIFMYLQLGWIFTFWINNEVGCVVSNYGDGDQAMWTTHFFVICSHACNMHIIIFRFHDYGRKGQWKLNESTTELSKLWSSLPIQMVLPSPQMFLTFAPSWNQRIRFLLAGLGVTWGNLLWFVGKPEWDVPLLMLDSFLM